jgi:hypothetical protein
MSDPDQRIAELEKERDWYKRALLFLADDLMLVSGAEVIVAEHALAMEDFWSPIGFDEEDVPPVEGFDD